MGVQAMQKVLAVILTVLYFVNSKYLLVKTEDGETTHSKETNDYRGGDFQRDYEANGADYNLFLSPISNSDKHHVTQSKGVNDNEANGADYNLFLSPISNSDKHQVNRAVEGNDSEA